MEFIEKFKPFLDSLAQCILAKNWYGALIIAVTLPDICVSVDGTQENEKQKLIQFGERRGSESKLAYIKWFDEYLDTLSKFKFINGSNAYALRCAVLHQGDSDIQNQRAADLRLGYKEVQFVLSDGSQKQEIIFQNQVLELDPSIELNQEEKVLYVEVSSFCRDIYQGASIWLERQMYYESQRIEKILDFNSNKLIKIKKY